MLSEEKLAGELWPYLICGSGWVLHERLACPVFSELCVSRIKQKYHTKVKCGILVAFTFLTSQRLYSYNILCRFITITTMVGDLTEVKVDS